MQYGSTAHITAANQTNWNICLTWYIVPDNQPITYPTFFFAFDTQLYFQKLFRLVYMRIILTQSMNIQISSWHHIWLLKTFFFFFEHEINSFPLKELATLGIWIHIPSVQLDPVGQLLPIPCADSLSEETTARNLPQFALTNDWNEEQWNRIEVLKSS